MQIYENLLSKMMHLKNTTTRREGVRITETIPMTFLFNMGLKLPTIPLKQKIVERMIRTNTFFARLARSPALSSSARTTKTFDSATVSNSS